jgi:hypothetical protein
MKASSKDYSSVVALLLKAKHKGWIVTLEKPVGGWFAAKHPFAWFPGAQLFIHVNTNRVYQMRQNGTGEWFVRKGRKNKWDEISRCSGGREFIDLITPYYVKYLNDTMTGAFDVP